MCDHPLTTTSSARELCDTLASALGDVRRFVRDTLGCGCPESVFEQVELLQNGAAPGQADLAVVIGGRLLVCLFQGERLAGDDQAALAARVEACVALRDGRGLNRCRLVLTSSPGPSTSAALQATIEAAVQSGDDRLHLHLM